MKKSKFIRKKVVEVGEREKKKKKKEGIFSVEENSLSLSLIFFFLSRFRRLDGLRNDSNNVKVVRPIAFYFVNIDSIASTALYFKL